MRKINKNEEQRTKNIFYTTHEMAAICNVSSTTIIKWLKEKDLDSKIRKTPGGHRRIPSGICDEFIDSFNKSYENIVPKETILNETAQEKEIPIKNNIEIQESNIIKQKETKDEVDMKTSVNTNNNENNKNTKKAIKKSSQSKQTKKTSKNNK